METMEGGGETVFPLIFCERGQEIDKGDVRLHATLSYEAFQSMLSEKVGISPEDFSIYLIYMKNSGVEEKDRKKAITCEDDFAGKYLAKDCYFLVVNGIEYMAEDGWTFASSPPPLESSLAENMILLRRKKEETRRSNEKRLENLRMERDNYTAALAKAMAKVTATATAQPYLDDFPTLEEASRKRTTKKSYYKEKISSEVCANERKISETPPFQQCPTDAVQRDNHTVTTTTEQPHSDECPTEAGPTTMMSRKPYKENDSVQRSQNIVIQMDNHTPTMTTAQPHSDELPTEAVPTTTLMSRKSGKEKISIKECTNERKSGKTAPFWKDSRDDYTVGTSMAKQLSKESNAARRGGTAPFHHQPNDAVAIPCEVCLNARRRGETAPFHDCPNRRLQNLRIREGNYTAGTSMAQPRSNEFPTTKGTDPTTMSRKSNEAKKISSEECANAPRRGEAAPIHHHPNDAVAIPCEECSNYNSYHLFNFVFSSFFDVDLSFFFSDEYNSAPIIISNLLFFSRRRSP